MTTEPILDRATIRKRLRTVDERDFIAAHTKGAFLEMCTVLGVEDPKGTKADLYQQLIDNAGLPDQSLRGRSSVDSPVAAMWELCDATFAAADPENLPRRRDVIEAAKAAGIAHHTARTQYQSWLTAVRDADGNIRRLHDLPVNELPRVLQPADDA